MSKNGPIVLVEDDVDDQELITEVIGKLGFSNTVKIFINGREALDYLQLTSEQPFIIFCDVNMPVMNGLELRQQINEDESLRRKSIPFVFLTTASDKRPIQKAYELNVQGFFTKPHDINELQSIMQCTLKYWQWCLHPNTN